MTTDSVLCAALLRVPAGCLPLAPGLSCFVSGSSRGYAAPAACLRWRLPLNPLSILSSSLPLSILFFQSPEVTKVRNDNRFGTNFAGSPEPIYGTQFLPRKFKIAVTVPGDNSVDIFTNDVALVVITNAEGELEGYNIYAGGGMGRAHRNDDTFARLASPLGCVASPLPEEYE